MKIKENLSQEDQKYIDRRNAEFMESISMTASEKKELLKWIKEGCDVYSNPWYYADEHGQEMNFIEAMRFGEDMFETMKENEQI